MSPIRAVFLDFDGVVLESADIKTRAFARLFAAHPEHVDDIVDLHLRLAGISRFEKFRQIHEDILGIAYADEDEERLGREFAGIVLEEVLACAFVPGAEEFIRSRCGELDLFVASGTPEEELRDIVEQRGIARCFRGVYGSPALKGEIVDRVRAEHGLERSECVFVGDAATDLDGARDAGIAFIGRVPAGEESPFGPDEVVVGDLAELDARWDEVCASLDGSAVQRR